MGFNRRLVHHMALVGRYSKLGLDSVVASPLCNTKLSTGARTRMWGEIQACRPYGEPGVGTLMTNRSG
ncbi:hypothetical protein YC2023_041300 [Brassica napus]